MAKREGEQVGQEAAEDDVEEDRRPAPVERRDRGDDEEDRALDADSRERDEDLVQPVDPVVDDPALEPGIEVSQAGTSCFVDSISCCGLNGLPMKPLAPRC
jgi:hypothetical protein